MSKRTEVSGEIASWEKNSKYKDLEAKKKKNKCGMFKNRKETTGARV